MRTRNEILAEYIEAKNKGQPISGQRVAELTLEVLLDVRDLLGRPATKHAISAEPPIAYGLKETKSP